MSLGWRNSTPFSIPIHLSRVLWPPTMPIHAPNFLTSALSVWCSLLADQRSWKARCEGTFEEMQETDSHVRNLLRRPFSASIFRRRGLPTPSRNVVPSNPAAAVEEAQ